MKRGTFAAPIGKAGQIRSANKKFPWIFFYSLRFAYWQIRIAGPIVLVQHKRNERMCEAGTTVCSALPIVIEITY
jgi:hypothetical protein